MYITNHAVERYRERTGSNRPDERVRERISRIVRCGRRVGRDSMYSDGTLMAVVDRGAVITVLPRGWRR